MMYFGSLSMMLVFHIALAMMMAQHVNGQYDKIKSPFQANDVFYLKSIVLEDDTNIIPVETTPAGGGYTTVFQPISNCVCDMSIRVANNMHSTLKITDMVTTTLSNPAWTYDLSVLDVTMSPLVTSTSLADAENEEAMNVEMAIAQILPTVNKILLESSADMPMMAVFEGHTGGAMIFEREY